MELIFEVREAEEGGYVARALGQAIFTEAETWAELRNNVLEVTALHFDDAATCAPPSPRLCFCGGRYLLHSGRPNRLWFHLCFCIWMNHLIQGYGLDDHCLLRKPVEEFATAL